MQRHKDRFIYLEFNNDEEEEEENKTALTY